MTISGPIVIGSLARGLAFSLVAGLVVGILGPFGTFQNLTIGWRIAFWMSAIAGGFLFHMPLYWLGRYITESQGWSIWIGIIGSAFVAALPTTVLVNGIAVSLLNTVTTDSVTTLYPMVLAISLPLQFIGHMTAFKAATQRGEVTAPTSPIIEPLDTTQSEDAMTVDVGLEPALDLHQLASQPNTSTPPPLPLPLPPPLPAPASMPSPFFARLPGRLGKDLLCLQMEDHYVRAFTALGSQLILMRMVDAARELDGYDGMLVHRSFWVARAGVVSWSRDGKNLTLRLSNNKNVPVARDRQTQVKSEGWLVGVSD